MRALKDRLRRFVRGVQRSGRFAVRLPHHRLDADGVELMGQGRRELTASQVRALELCDGTHTAAEVSRDAGVPRSWIVQAQEHDLILLWRRAVPTEPPKLAGPPQSIIVSPHPDDAALSCGGRMLRGQGMLVVNIFSKTAWWRFPLSDTDLEKIQACRAGEEALVSRLSGAEVRALDLPEALLRGHKLEEMFGVTPGDNDREVSKAIGRALFELAVKHPPAHWCLPLGVGDHIDHRIVRDAARTALGAAGVNSTHVHFYEDLPYAAKLGADADFSGQVPGLTLRENILDVRDVIDSKIELLRAYWSQFTRGSLEELRRYARAVGGEVVWDPAP